MLLAAPLTDTSPEATTRRWRSTTSALRRSTDVATGRSIARSNSYHAAFVLATLTRHVMSASAAVISPTTAPVAS